MTTPDDKAHPPADARPEPPPPPPVDVISQTSHSIVINGEMVVQDGGSHLRGSGAEDLLQWTDAQWEKQRAARAKN